ncbi:MAG: hydantoinase/oxoprolinase family protein [Rhodospirillales bacterium]|nr:hydantoinase/oxoprolinase family protein [Rhodospirillales bacterium]
MKNPGYTLGIDVGGTFTDLVLIRLSDGHASVHKISSTPDDPSRAVAQGTIELLKQAGVKPAEVSYFGHGTTVATNALILQRTAPTGLVTTDGFRDLLEIRRQRQPHNYNIRMPKPTPPVARHLRREIAERTYLFGRDSVPPRLADLDAIATDFLKAKVEAVAVCFIHSYRNPEHEAAVVARLRKLMPGIFICASHEVLAEFREYERISTTVLNASLGPVMSRYLAHVGERAKNEVGLAVPPNILQSNGGVASPAEASRLPVRTLASGPAAGVTGAVHLAREGKLGDIITFDVGGTSTDVCLVEAGVPMVAREREFGGYPVRFPMIDVHSVGAGGGSIAWVDSGGFLHVGPQSAGAKPGPACYGLGGTEPTVTDANVVLGRLNPTHLLAGRMPIKAELSRTAIQEKIAKPMGLSLEKAAHGILTILNENMIQAIRVISVEQGFDPRDFSLFAFGGAGPLLASMLARELDMRRVIVPTGPGLLCAMGLLVADIRTDFGLTRISALDPKSADAINAGFADVTRQAEAWFKREGIPPSKRAVSYAIDMRYVGQSHELRVEVPKGRIKASDLKTIEKLFVREHERVYGYAQNAKVQLVTFRVTAKGRVSRPPVGDSRATARSLKDAEIGRRRVHFQETGGFVDCPVYDRARLPLNAKLKGPAILEQMDTTTIVLPKQRLACDRHGNLILTVS